MSRRRGFTVPELLITMAIASMMLTAGWFLLNMANQVYKKVSGNEDAAMQLKKASRLIQQELLISNFNHTLIAPVPSSLAGPDGDGIAMVSSKEQGRAAMARRPEGQPFWQRNIVFYLVVPSGDPCTGATGPDGYEDACPHKVLVRKIIDAGSPTNPPWGAGNNNPLPESEGGNGEEVLPALLPYLTRPGPGLNVSGMAGEAGLESVDVVATHLLSMRVQKDPNPAHPGEILITLRAFNPDASNKTTAVGSTPLSAHENTLTHLVSVFPRNNQ